MPETITGRVLQFTAGVYRVHTPDGADRNGLPGGIPGLAAGGPACRRVWPVALALQGFSQA